MNIAIVDHCAEDRRLLWSLLSSAMAKRSVACAIEQYGDVADLLGDVEDGVGYDAVFLDLSEAGGISAAHRIRELGYEGELVFTSSTAGFAVEGYELGATGYLLKPFREERLLRLVASLCARERPRCLIVRHYRTVVRVPYHEILFLESRNTKCVVHRHSGEEYTIYRQLDELQRELCDDRFLRCHQSYLVNMDHIVSADTQFVMDGGKTVSIRQRELRSIRERFLSYMTRSEAALASRL